MHNIGDSSSAQAKAQCLTWGDATRLAQALCTAYPEAIPAVLTQEDVRCRVVSLPAFSDALQPADERVLRHVLWTWLRCVAETPPDAAAEGA